jgi:hypothetical protein
VSTLDAGETFQNVLKDGEKAKYLYLSTNVNRYKLPLLTLRLFNDIKTQRPQSPRLSGLGISSVCITIYYFSTMVCRCTLIPLSHSVNLRITN